MPIKSLFLFLLAVFAYLLSEGQNVGIGTSTPNQKLDVNGWIKLGDQTAAVPPNSHDEGSIRYNSSSKCIEYNRGGAATDWTKLASLADAVPPGAIIMWSGSFASIPSGWALCDGTGGTPDLTNKFILGATTTTDVGVTGGSHSHTITVSEMPAHTHTGTTDATMPAMTFTGTDATISTTASFTGTSATITPTATFSGAGVVISPTATFTGATVTINHTASFSGTGATITPTATFTSGVTSSDGAGQISDILYDDGNAPAITSGTLSLAGGRRSRSWSGTSGDAMRRLNISAHSHTVTGTVNVNGASYTPAGSVSVAGAPYTPAGTIAVAGVPYTPGGNVSVTGASYIPAGTVSMNAVSYTPAGSISGSSHTHTFTTDSAGSGTAVDIRPSFYTLAYIIKL